MNKTIVLILFLYSTISFAGDCHVVEYPDHSDVVCNEKKENESTNSSVKDSDDIDGFRGISWGADASKIKGLRYQETDPAHGGIQFYSREGDALKIGAADLQSILYGFWRGKFATLKINVFGYLNYSTLKDAFEQKYRGAIIQSRKDLDPDIWVKDSGCAILIYNPFSKKAVLSLDSNEYSEKMKQYSKGKEGAATGF